MLAVAVLGSGDCKKAFSNGANRNEGPKLEKLGQLATCLGRIQVKCITTEVSFSIFCVKIF